MEVKTSQFFSKHYKRSVVVYLVWQSTIFIIAGSLAYAAWYNHLGTALTAMLSLGSFILIELLAGPLILSGTLKPLEVISQAIAHVSNDPVKTPPPRLEANSNAQVGLKTMVQTIYELAASPRPAVETKQVSSNVSKDLLSLLFDNAPIGIIGINNAHEIVVANAAAPVHRRPDGRLILDLYFDKNRTLSDWLKSAQANKLHDTKTWARIADRLPGEENRHIFDLVASYNKSVSSTIETVVVTVDRTQQYAPFEEDMDFIALAAHELRGPITVIRGYLDILSEELRQQLQLDQEELVDRLQVSAEQLAVYVDNILNVSRYDRHHLLLRLHEERLLDILQIMLPGLVLKAKTKKRRLSFYIPDDLPTLAADSTSLSEVISNLIDNAIKYSTENGEIIVRAVVNGDFVEITVQDFGIGIPSSIMDNLFTKFYRSHRSRQQVGGTGLGLYICKAIVESHGGHVWVRSKEGEGSIFGFTIPIYASVADKLAKSDNRNDQIIERPEGWIKNHAMLSR